MGKNRFNGDMSNNRGRTLIDHIHGGSVEKCQLYDGEACKKFLAGQKILMEEYKTDDDLLNVGKFFFLWLYRVIQTQRLSTTILHCSCLYLEIELKAAIISINNQTHISDKCKELAQEASCYHNYQVCDSDPTIGTQVPQTLRICK